MFKRTDSNFLKSIVILSAIMMMILIVILSPLIILFEFLFPIQTDYILIKLDKLHDKIKLQKLKKTI